MLHVIGVLREGIFLHHDFNNIVKVSCLLCNVAMERHFARAGIAGNDDWDRALHHLTFADSVSRL